jgi:hypothetical protein
MLRPFCFAQNPKFQNFASPKPTAEKLNRSKVIRTSLPSRNFAAGLLEGLSPMLIASQEAGRKKRPSKPPSAYARAWSSHPDWVMSLPEWAYLNGFSPRTARRIIARGEGPMIIQLSKQKPGVTNAANRAWQAARARKRGRTK